MKESEIIQKEIDLLTDQDDTDGWKYLRLSKSLQRAKQYEQFNEVILPELKKLYEIEHCETSMFYLIKGKSGQVRYFPKARKMFMCGQRKWMKLYPHVNPFGVIVSILK